MSDYLVGACVLAAAPVVAARVARLAAAATPQDWGCVLFGGVLAALIVIRDATEVAPRPPRPRVARRPRRLTPPPATPVLDLFLKRAAAWGPRRYANWAPEAGSHGSSHCLYLRARLGGTAIGFVTVRNARAGFVGAFVLGDSFCDDLSTLQRSWPTRLYEATSLRSGALVNVSVGGSTSNDLARQVALARRVAHELGLDVTRDTVAVVHAGGNDVLLHLLRYWWVIWLDALRLIAWDGLGRPAYLRPWVGVRRGRGDVDFERARGPTFFGAVPRRAVERVRAALLDAYDGLGVSTCLVCANTVSGAVPLGRAVLGGCLFRSVGPAGAVGLLDRAAAYFKRAHVEMLADVADETGMDARFFDEAAALTKHAADGPAAFWLDAYHPSSFGHSRIVDDAVRALGRPRVAPPARDDPPGPHPFFGGDPPPRRFAAPVPVVR